ncbi:MAG: LamG domain-containing protein, partial [Planctomycetales bacterium]
TLPLEVWIHVAAIADGEQLRIYQNGELAASVPCSGLATAPPTPLWIGVGSNGNNLWEGRIDELALYDKALSEEQVRALRQAAPQR